MDFISTWWKHNIQLLPVYGSEGVEDGGWAVFTGLNEIVMRSWARMTPDSLMQHYFTMYEYIVHSLYGC